MSSPTVIRNSLPTAVRFVSVLCVAASANASCHFPDWETEAAVGCAGYASGTCQALARCGDAFLSPYGSYEACVSELSAGCTYSLGLPDVFGSGAGAAACGEMMRSVACDALQNGELPEGCGAPGGNRRDGAPCRLGSQCASARCVHGRGSEWGECRQRLSRGEACTAHSDCAQGLSCSLLGTCVVLGQSGEPCGVERSCRSPLACVAGRCSAVEPAPTCQAFAETLCAQLGRCSAWLVRSVYGELATCAARNAESCLASVTPTEGTRASAGVASCTRALDTVRCEELLDHALPAACQLAPGTRDNGEPCNSAAQCASMRCAYGVGSACGVCSPLAALRDTCAADSDCTSGAVCSGGSCRLPSGLGASCDTAQRCAYPWVCAAGSCSATLALGEVCSFAADRCDRYQGLMCGSAGTCEAWRSALAPDACNQTPSGWVACAGGSSCLETSAGEGCSGPLADGSPCTAGEAPFCLAPAQCLGGACALASSVSCS